MRNESSACETTPLRRPESGNSEEFGSKPVASTLNALNSANNYANSEEQQQFSVIGPHQQPSQQQQQQIPQRSITLNNAGIASVVFASNTDTNVNSVGNRLGNDSDSSQQSSNNCANNISNLNNNNNNNNSGGRNIESKMDTNQRVLIRICMDAFILLTVALPILCFFIWGDSYKRGFFCDDESLKHPFKESTVKNWMLYVIGLVIPVGVILTIEIIRSSHNARASNGNSNSRRYVLSGCVIPDWLVESYKKIGVFGFAVAVSQLTTDIAKYSIGRLRPHFFAVCQPVINDGSTCIDPKNIGRYIEDFRCAGEGSTQRMLKEVTLSFPSGHSSFTFCTMIYLALYLQARMTWRGSKLLRHFLQFIFIMIAWYTALSRVSDYKHHWSDVLAGSTVGTVIAIVVACFVSDLFQKRAEKTYVMSPHTPDTVIITNGC